MLKIVIIYFTDRKRLKGYNFTYKKKYNRFICKN